MPVWHFATPLVFSGYCFLGLGRTASGLVSYKLATGAQCNRQNCLMLSRLGDNLSESPNAAIKAEHGTQRLRLFKIVPLACLWCGKVSSRGLG
jgi:hypothetical protein